jgi:hypothetical protein
LRYDGISGFVSKLFLSLAVLSSAGWAFFLLLNSDHAVELNNIANRIMSGDGFREKQLSQSIPLLETAEERAICNPLELRGAAIIRLRLFDDAMSASDTRLADQRLKLLRSSVDQALGCVPTEGFLWFIRYWSAVNAGSPATDHFEELRISYVLSPYEGWIALRRSPYALAIYETLPADIKEMALNELVAIIASGFIGDAVKIMKGPGWQIRDQLLPRLEKVSLDIRLQFDRALRAEGLPLKLPGVEVKEFRPWH